MYRFWACLLVGVGVCGCGPKLRGSVAFTGRARPPIVAPEKLLITSTLPAGHRELGQATASCVLTSARSLRGAWLSDVDCSEQRIRAAIRERAAAVGGTVLVALECRSERRRSPRSDAVWVAVRCDTTVAAPRTAPEGPRQPKSSPTHGATEAWRIRVDYQPVLEVARRAPRAPDTVRELATMPPSHLRLGDIITWCEEGCSERGVYDGLFATAGRMGASDVVGINCVERRGGWLCSATAAGYRVEPDAAEGS